MTSGQPQIKKGIYQHYKGNKYEVIDLARHSETGEWLVVYKTLYKSDSTDKHLWVRPFSMFTECVNVDGKEIPRFRYIGN